MTINKISYMKEEKLLKYILSSNHEYDNILWFV